MLALATRAVPASLFGPAVQPTRRAVLSDELKEHSGIADPCILPCLLTTANSLDEPFSRMKSKKTAVLVSHPPCIADPALVAQPLPWSPYPRRLNPLDEPFSAMSSKNTAASLTLASCPGC